LNSSSKAFHEILSLSMSILFSDTLSFPQTPARQGHQSNSGSQAARQRGWLGWAERRRQRAALRDLAEDTHLLDDLGVTREQALREAAKPFWH
jgi:uncharacterized protein YjiS (DUF1127 family)